MGRISSVLVANRGEIARRVFRTCRALGLRTVAVASEVDRGLPYAREADVAVLLDGPPDARATYLDAGRLLDAARRAGADAVHPGYGFLSENADFAQAVLDAGLAWLGPPPAAIRAMGDKAKARAVAVAHGVPVVPGLDEGALDDARVAALGFPVLVKAVAGGGGRGMRRVDRPEDLAEAIRSAKAEARAAFGADGVIVERYVVRPRHVEVQVAGDAHGDVVALGDRDCSIQRRHQKIVEEAPAPGLSDATRAAMADAAVRVARAVGYTSVGTVEFVVETHEDGRHSFYFLEMNTRLQVEHPVTEAVTGLDLVALQVAIAEGGRVPRDVVARGHAIEARIVAEDPLRDFLPATGRLLALHVADGVRVDAGFAEGDVVSPHYDALLAKVIAHGPDRAAALRRLGRALDGAWAPGVVTNLPLLRQLAASERFAAPTLDTGFLAAAGLPQPPPPNVALGVLAAVAFGFATRPRRGPPAFRIAGPATQSDTFRAGGGEVVARWTPAGDGLDVTIGGAPHALRGISRTAEGLRVAVDGLAQDWRIRLRSGAATLEDGDALYVHAGDRESFVELVPRFPAVDERPAEPGAAVAPTPGTVTSVRVAEGDRVEAGQLLVTLEAMKMEHRVTAPAAGTVAAVRVAPGQAVGEGDVLVRLDLP